MPWKAERIRGTVRQIKVKNVFGDSDGHCSVYGQIGQVPYLAEVFCHTSPQCVEGVAHAHNPAWSEAVFLDGAAAVRPVLHKAYPPLFRGVQQSVDGFVMGGA
jgi:hypothetical protein